MFKIESESNAKIRVIGIGGGGGNAVNNMVDSGLDGVEFIVCNTDNQALQNSLAHEKLQFGHKLTSGLGAGANPEIGWKAAMESQGEISEMLADCDMVFVTAGMGGGTGTGGIPVVAQTAKDMGILTVGVVTMPFRFEGARRRKNAEMGLAELQQAVDTLIVIPNDRLLDIAHDNMTMIEAFVKADTVLLSAVRGICDIVITPGLINVDFADVRTIMTDGGMALMGQGTASGEGRSLAAAQAAVNSPLLDGVSIEGATGILVNVTGGQDLTLREVNEAVLYIQEQAHPDANIIFGSVVNLSTRDEVQVTVIATGGQNAKMLPQGAQEDVVLEVVGKQNTMQAAQQTVLPTIRNPYESPAMHRRTPPVNKAETAGTESDNLQGTTVHQANIPMPQDGPSLEPFGGPEESEYETPAFLRRR